MRVYRLLPVVLQRKCKQISEQILAYLMILKKGVLAKKGTLAHRGQKETKPHSHYLHPKHLPFLTLFRC
jgi:hypothetical protein